MKFIREKGHERVFHELPFNSRRKNFQKNVGRFFNHDPLRARKLLIHRKEINKLRVSTEKKGLTIVPLSISSRNSVYEATASSSK